MQAIMFRASEGKSVWVVGDLTPFWQLAKKPAGPTP
jgi:hypothetical protein